MTGWVCSCRNLEGLIGERITRGLIEEVRDLSGLYMCFAACSRKACALRYRAGSRVFLLLCVCVAWASCVSRSLAEDVKDGPVAEFRALELKREVAPGSAEQVSGVVELEYEYTNTGDLPLIVQKFGQSCGCMSGEWDEEPVEPGTSGRIKARFLTKGLRGTVRKSLDVKFLEYKTVRLTAEVVIPEMFAYSTRTVRWSLGEEAVAREVDIRVNSKHPVRILSVGGGGGMFESELRELEEGRHYRVSITPRDTLSERVGTFQVRTEAKDPRDALQGLFGVIEKPPVDGGKGARR